MMLNTSLNETHHVHLCINGKSMCGKVFKLFYGLSNNKYAHALELTSNLLTLILHRNIRNLHTVHQPMHVLTHYWFLDFLRANGDFDLVTCHIHVLSYIIKDLLFKLFIEEQVSNMLILKASAYKNYIKVHFLHV